MSLDRYTNNNELLDNRGLRRGIIWKQDTLKFLNLKQLSIIPGATPAIEMHVYAPTSNELLSSVDVTEFIYKQDKIFIDYISEFNKINIQRGYFSVAVNVYQPIIGSSAVPVLTIKEISPDRRELQIVIRPDIDEIDAAARKQILNTYLETYATAYDADLALNFGKNNIYKIINQKEWINEDDLVLRLYEPLDENIELNDTCWLIEQFSDSIIDSVNLNLTPAIPEPNVLRGPNFDVDAEYNTITETNFKTWNDLLDANTTTTQQIVDSYFSGSLGGINLGIDYTGFQNFINYSSAFERVSNFNYKLQLIEYYDSQVNTLQNASGSDGNTLQGNISKFTKRKNNVLGQFDAFEKYLYYEPTSSLATHGIEGGTIGAQEYVIRPYPKYLNNGVYKIHATTGSLATSWFEGVSATASLYDKENNSALIKTIPEHIRLDQSNSEYELFVNMIAQHFDIIWTYVDALTRVYKLEEQPKLSIDKSILPNIAKSLGWELANGKQATQLWQYRLGTDSTGLYAQSGSIFSQSDEEITGEVWRRIVNNLPYLLKTKGTERSVKALMNMYGIPQTLLSIREYGGPKTSAETPALIEDKFSYAVQFDSGSNIKFSSNHVASKIGDWGIDRGTIPPITREFRFKPYAKENMMILSSNNSSNQPNYIIAVEHTGSYSGSNEFGRLVLSYGKAVSNTVPMTASSDWVPIYNGQYWNVKYDYTTTGNHFNSGSNTDTTYNITVQNASDFIFGKINYSSSLSITPTFGNHYDAWSEASTDTTKNIIHLGASTSSTDALNVQSYLNTFLGSEPDTFSGSMQEYREWLELINQKTFDRHTLNPTSYVSSLTPSSSFDTLMRQYTLGSNTIGFDLSSNETIISSSHPNQNLTFATNATSIGFDSPLNDNRGNFIPVEEVYYIEGVSSGMNSTKSQKIRFDDNTLFRTLSPTSTAEQSKFDYASLDSNKLGLFYSFADQVNKDIFNQVGDVELDDFIGDPDDEFQTEYPLLKQFSQKYFKKFTNTSDINSYIRIFSQYDFALFHQIQQLLAERIDEATGLLIEPNVLERSKQIISKKPSVSKPMYDMHVPTPSPTSSAIIGPQFNALIDKPISVTSSSIQTELLFNVETIQTPTTMSLDDIVADIARPSAIFKEVVLHYSGSVPGSLRNDKVKVNQAHAISQSLGLFYSRSLKEADYMDDQFLKETSIKYLGTQLTAPGINIPSTIDAIGRTPIIEVFETNPNQLIYSRQPKAPRGSNRILPGNLRVE